MTFPKTILPIRAVNDEDRGKIAEFIRRRWGGEMVVVHDVVYTPHRLPGFIYERDGRWLGLLTYHVEGTACEIVTLNSLEPGRGIGTALVEVMKEAAGKAGCRRLRFKSQPQIDLEHRVISFVAGPDGFCPQTLGEADAMNFQSSGDAPPPGRKLGCSNSSRANWGNGRFGYGSASGTSRIKA